MKTRGRNSQTKGRAPMASVLSISILFSLAACSEKRTNPADLSTTVIEYPDTPTLQDRVKAYHALEKLKEFNERYLDAPTARQRQVAQQNLIDIAWAKNRLTFEYEDAG